MVNRVDLFLLDMYVLIKKDKFYEGKNRRWWSNLVQTQGSESFQSTRPARVFVVTALLGTFSRYLQRLCLMLSAWFVKIEAQELALDLESLFKRWERWFRPILGKLSMMILQIALTCCSKKETHFKHFSIFLFSFVDFRNKGE